MIERPILFSGAMVRALLDGSKTQTRRLVKPAPEMVRDHGIHPWDGEPAALLQLLSQAGRSCPYGQPGDRLWVRETWADLETLSDGNFARQAIYRADDIEQYGNEDEYVDVTASDMRWRASIHMPRWASRILLEVVSVRVERLSDCSRADAIAEGIERVENNYGNGPAYCDYRMKNPDDTTEWLNSPIDSYRTLWETINGRGSWDANPWVWVVEFKRLTPSDAP